MNRPRLSYANVASTLALFVALGGVSWAATTLPKNSVGNKQLRSNAVTSGKIKKGQVRSTDIGSKAVGNAKLADGSVTVGKLGEGAVTGGKLGEGAVTTGKLAENGVTAGKLADQAVTGPKLGDNAVTSAKVADGAIGAGDLSAGVRALNVAAFASIDGFGPTIQGTYKRNALSVTRNGGPGQYCLNIDWAAAGRTPAQQATPVIVSARSATQLGGGDVYNPACANDGVSIQLRNRSDGSLADGWVHVLIP